MFQRFFITTCAGLLLLSGCSREVAQKPPELPGKWIVDYRALADHIMGSEMAPQYYKDMFANLTTTVVFRPGGDLAVETSSPVEDPREETIEGTWNVVSRTDSTMLVRLGFAGTTEEIKVEFLSNDRIRMTRPPLLFTIPPAEHIDLRREQ